MGGDMWWWLVSVVDRDCVRKIALVQLAMPMPSAPK